MHAVAVAVVSVGLFLSLLVVQTQAGPDPGQHPARFEAKVLRVYSAKQGTGVFRAYLVEWQGQKVIASDPRAQTKFDKGDKIQVLFMHTRLGNQPSLLSFDALRPFK